MLLAGTERSKVLVSAVDVAYRHGEVKGPVSVCC